MFPPETIQILERGQSRVVVSDPPYYTFAAIVIAFAVLLIIVGAVLILRTPLPQAGWIVVAVALIPTVVGLYMATSSTLITLAKDDGLMRIQRHSWGMRRAEQTVRSADIQRVTVERARNARLLVIVTKSGASIPAGNGSNRQGYYGAAEAINEFLGVPAAAEGQRRP
jgi:hypothetical protein